jgi:hypothetical protein
MADLQEESTAQFMRFPRKLCRNGAQSVRTSRGRLEPAYRPDFPVRHLPHMRERNRASLRRPAQSPLNSGKSLTMSALPTGIAMCAMPVCRRLSEMMSEQRYEEN